MGVVASDGQDAPPPHTWNSLSPSGNARRCVTPVARQVPPSIWNTVAGSAVASIVTLNVGVLLCQRTVEPAGWLKTMAGVAGSLRTTRIDCSVSFTGTLHPAQGGGGAMDFVRGMLM